MVWKPGSKHSDPSSRVIARRNDWNSICVLHQGPRSMAASRGRIHDRSPIACRNTKKTLAERGPSIHDGGGSVPLLPAINLPAHQRDRLLVDARGVPGLDGGKVRLARLVAGARLPAMGAKEVRG